MLQAYTQFWSNYTNFTGRTSRKNYWYCVLFNVLIGLLVTTITLIIHLALISSLFYLAMFVPTISITIRRLNDSGQDWRYIFVGLIPVIGQIWLIVLLTKPGIKRKRKKRKKTRPSGSTSKKQ